LRRRFGSAVVTSTCSRRWAPRRDWVLTLISDGYVTVRHRTSSSCSTSPTPVGTDVRLYAA
jgi:hypothetical protein